MARIYNSLQKACVFFCVCCIININININTNNNNNNNNLNRYASLFFIVCIEEADNEILAMEMIHQFVEVLDSYFGNVCELDLIFNFDKAHYILDELIMAGAVQETSKREIIRVMKQQDDIEQKIKDERKGKKGEHLKNLFH